MTVSTDLAFAARRSGDIRLIGSVSLAHCISHFYMLVLPPLFAVVQAEYGVSYTELGLCFTVFNGASALLQTQAGFLVDRGNARLALVAGLLIEAAAFVVAAGVHSYWVLVAMFAVMGVGNTVFHPADYSLLSHRVSMPRMSKAYSLHGFAGMLGSAAAPAGVLAMYGLYGWRGAFLGTAILGAIAAMIVLFMVDDGPREAPKPRDSAAASADRALLLSTPILMNFVFFLLLALASFGLQNFLVVGLGALHHTDPVAANAALSGNLLMSAFGVLLGGFIASRVRQHRLLASVGLSASVVATLLMANLDLSAGLLFAVMSVAGLLYGMVMPSRDMIVREVTPPGAFGKVFGFVTNGFNIAGILAPLIFGALLDNGAGRSFFYLNGSVRDRIDRRGRLRAAPPAGMISPLRALLLLWLAGVALRLTILAVPPVIPLIHADLHLSETQVGILSGLPMVLFAGAAIAGSLMIARLGALNALHIGIAMCAFGSVLRGVGPSVAMLYVGTAVMAFGVAVMQPSLPPLVRSWVPQRIGFATAIYTNGLLIGEILPAALTIPLLLPLIQQSWPGSFLFWGLLVAAIGGAIISYAPKMPAAAPTTASRRWMPDFHDPKLWRIGLLLGSVNATYFAMNGFLPDYLTHTGRPELINASLTALNLGQLPASFLLLASADRMVRTMWSYLGCGLVCLVSMLAIVFLGDAWVVAGCALWGCAGAAVLVLVLALPPLIAPAEDVHRVTAGMFTISYSCAVVVPIISGALWDLTGWTLAPFIPIGVCTLVLLGLAPTVVLREKAA